LYCGKLQDLEMVLDPGEGLLRHGCYPL
jgi:hypothetical protein